MCDFSEAGQTGWSFGGLGGRAEGEIDGVRLGTQKEGSLAADAKV